MPSDFIGGYGEDDVDRPRLIATLRSYLLANNLNADWERINSASNERLVNTLSILSPYGPEEKQACSRRPDLRSRAEALVALAEMELAATRRRLGDIAAMMGRRYDDGQIRAAAVSGGSIPSCWRSWSVL